MGNYLHRAGEKPLHFTVEKPGPNKDKKCPFCEKNEAATPLVPKNVKEELEGSKEYFELKGKCLFCNIVEQEIALEERLLWQDENFISLCPFASSFTCLRICQPSGSSSAVPPAKINRQLALFFTCRYTFITPIGSLK